jgi:hypothetical protein
MATRHLGIQSFDFADHAHDPRPLSERQNQSTAGLRSDLDTAFELIDASGSAAGYSPVSGSQWDAPAPTTIGQALDRLANMVFLGLTGSIQIL